MKLEGAYDRFCDDNNLERTAALRRDNMYALFRRVIEEIDEIEVAALGIVTPEVRARRLVLHLKAAGEHFENEQYVVHELTQAILREAEMLRLGEKARHG